MGALACTARRPRLTCFTCRPAIRIWTYMHARTHAHTHTRVERARMSIPPKFPTRALDCMHIHSRRAPRKSAARAAVHSLAWRPAGLPQLDHRIGRDVAALNARTSIDHMNARTLIVDAHACVDIGKQRAQRSAAQRAQRSRHRSARPPAPTGAPLPAGRAARCDRIHDRSIMNARMRSIEYNVARTIKLHTRFGQAAHPARSAPLGAPAGAKDMAWRGCSALPCLAAGRAWCECTHIDQENAYNAKLRASVDAITGPARPASCRRARHARRCPCSARTPAGAREPAGRT